MKSILIAGLLVSSTIALATEVCPQFIHLIQGGNVLARAAALFVLLFILVILAGYLTPFIAKKGE